ncbi:hypothetical protein D9611_013346 [Ephemerocybe angulata]|uniref:F-box domain-containing protein n=1 Tax=Ephemerocybe angulata TaxID=980116 RepID=A0A8H5CDD3_9AGAR|nr:hypothetical protein D9611_013346 [Tulosesus angulatus]
MQSPFESILHTNHIPTEEQCKAIEDFLEFPEKQLVELDSKIAEVDLQLRELQNKRDSLEWVASPLRQAVKAHRAVISLARRLPDDVYQEIFPYCLPVGSYPTPNPLDAPIVLTHVCRRWRHIAHSTPRLWSRLHIKPLAKVTDEYNATHNDRSIPTKEWIQRASAIPLSLSFCSASRYKPSAFDVRRLFQSLILPSSAPLWNSFGASLAGSKEEILEALVLPGLQEATKNPFWNAPKLTIAIQHVEGADGYSTRLPNPLVLILKTMELQRNTRLRELTFIYGDYDRDLGRPLTTYLPCAQLEILDLQNPQSAYQIFSNSSVPSPMAYDILKCCPNLIVLRLEVSQWEANLGDQIPPERYVMEHMKELSISSCDLNEETDVAWLPKFDFPALTCLHLRGHTRYNPGSECATLPYVLARVGHNLTSLVLDPGYLEQAPLIAALELLPSLVQLHLKSAYFAKDFDDMEDEDKEVAKWTDEVLNCLIPQDDQDKPHACPRLQYLKWQYNTCFSEDALLELLYQRSSHPSSPVPLKQAHIDFGRLRTNSGWEGGCWDLMEAGLDLRVTYLDPIYFEEKNQVDARVGDEFRVELPIFEKSGYLDFGWE